MNTEQFTETNTETIAVTSVQQNDTLTHLPINVGTLESIVSLVVILFAIGVAWGSLRRTVSQIGKTLQDEVKPDLQDVRERVVAVEEQVNRLWQAHHIK